ncbi:MAG: ATP-binding cassette domain-containing protein [Chloroflexi bacterium]|nr:ATP-binding cassette domain-containing protein [Chloroflexota bacterium]
MSERTDDGQKDGETVLEVHDLTKVFGSGETAVRAVDGVGLSVKRGEIVLVMGPSGSGKTTLLTMIGSLLKPTTGTIRINGLDITSLHESELTKVRRHYVGFVFQSFNLLESLNAQENVEVALNLAGNAGKGARNKARQALVDLGMKPRLKFKPKALSGGEKQRVSIARAVVNDPQLILADEPTANLDSKQGHDVVVLLRDIAKKEGRTVVIVSHDHRIREVADRVLWLEDGRFKDIGRLERDPVCGMAIEAEGAPTLQYEGRTYYFCSVGCRGEFEEQPAKFVAVGTPSAAQSPISGD